MIRRGYLSPTCAECGRTFDLLNPSDAEEWAYGHDCEEPCRYCGGNGTVAAMTPIGEVWPKPCPQCATEACAECSGAGYVPAIGAEDEQADGYVPCDACNGEGER